MKYDYFEAVCDDVREYIIDEVDLYEFDDIDELVEALHDRCWICDSVTGNASGSYTFNSYKAEENLCHNLDLLLEACQEFDIPVEDYLEEGAEACDISIRCYLLPQAINKVLENCEDEINLFYEMTKDNEMTEELLDEKVNDIMTDIKQNTCGTNSVI